jgi:hypothetical protein
MGARSVLAAAHSAKRASRWPTSAESVDENRTYRSDLSRRRTQRYAQTVEVVVTVVRLVEVDRHEVRLLVAAGGVLVALVEPDVTNQVPVVSRAVPRGSTAALDQASKDERLPERRDVTARQPDCLAPPRACASRWTRPFNSSCPHRPDIPPSHAGGSG